MFGGIGGNAAGSPMTGVNEESLSMCMGEKKATVASVTRRKGFGKDVFSVGQLFISRGSCSRPRIHVVFLGSRDGRHRLNGEPSPCGCAYMKFELQGVCFKKPLIFFGLLEFESAVTPDN